MEPRYKDKTAYRQVAEAFKKQPKGATIADIVAKTALPLNTVRELVPSVADEYSARFEVTESGEILYSFPQGFTSKYRGFVPALRRFSEKLFSGAKVLGSLLFKGWIMVMLLGYFTLFMLIALAALLLSVTAGASNSNDRSSGRRNSLGGMYLASHIFSFIIKIWFYSELSRSMDQAYYRGRYANRNSSPNRPKGRPLYKAIFSFVFGDEDPNKDWTVREKKILIAYIQAHKGVISLPEFMAISGLSPEKAGDAVTACCVEFGGSPEATEDGTVVYRFDELLLRGNKQDFSLSGMSSPLKRLKKFSSNLKKMNIWFTLINGVNLVFGSYFLTNALNAGTIRPQGQFNSGPYLYGITHALFSAFTENPRSLIAVGLGIIPLIFSILFWLIPALRYFIIKKENEEIKLENFRRTGYGRIWSSPLAIKNGDIKTQAEECRPGNLAAAEDRIIKEMGSYAAPDVELDPAGNTVYAFGELKREKDALEKYREKIKPEDSALGNTIFDTHR
jgi:hypothetical protein